MFSPSQQISVTTAAVEKSKGEMEPSFGLSTLPYLWNTSHVLLLCVVAVNGAALDVETLSTI